MISSSKVNVFQYLPLSYMQTLILTALQKVLFMAVIPEVVNRGSIFSKKLRAPGFSPRRVAEVTRLRQQ